MTRSTGNGGFSLLETVIASGIAAVLGLVVFTLVRTLRDVREAQRGADDGPAALSAAADLLSRDLACCFPAEDDEAKLWLAPTNAAGVASSFLRMTVFSPAPGEEDLAWAEPLRVEWLVVADAGGVPGLARIAKVLAGPRADEPAVTNRLVSPVAIFSVRLSDTRENTDSWSPKKRKDLPVSAEFRIALADAGETGLVVKVATPAGAKIPRTRGTAVAAPSP